MPFERPTLPTLIKRVETDLKGGAGVVTILRRSFLGALSRAVAGVSHLLHGFLDFLSKQVFPDTAELEYLERWASIWGITRRVATFAEFEVTLIGTDGTVVPVNTVYQRDDGLEYLTDAEATISGGTATVKLVAQISGETGNLEVSDTISIQSPIAGLNSVATVSSIVVEADDTETDSLFRERFLDFLRNRPSGGAANDYVQWALEVPGITRAWVLPQNLGPGTVGVSVVDDTDDPITVSPAKITEVQEYIDDPTRRPVTANVTVTTPNLVEIDMTIELKPNTTAVQDAVIAELEDLILRDAALAGAFKSPSETHDGKILLSRLNEAISIAVGEEDHNITVINGGAPADVTPSTGELLVLGTITWLPLA